MAVLNIKGISWNQTIQVLFIIKLPFLKLRFYEYNIKMLGD